MYETNGVLNESIVKGLVKYCINSKLKKIIKIFFVIYFLLGILTIVLGLSTSRKDDVLYGVIYEIIAFGFLWHALAARLRFRIDNIDKMKEISNKGEFEFKVFFNENSVHINNLTTSAIIEIKYEFFNRLEETTNMYILFTKSGQYALVFKNCLSDEDIKSFKGFIKEKCKNIK